jgi:hypothetical protein
MNHLGNLESDCTKYAEKLSQIDREENEYLDKCSEMNPRDCYKALRKEYSIDGTLYIMVNDTDMMKKVIEEMNKDSKYLKVNIFVDTNYAKAFIKEYEND